VYWKNSGKDTYEEHESLGAILVGGRFARAWEFSHLRVDFFDVKGFVENFLRSIRVTDWTLTEGCSFPYDPAQSIRILFTDSSELGCFGRIDGNLLEALDIGEVVYGVELYPHKVFPVVQRTTKFTSFSRYPSAARDISLVVPLNVSCEEIRDTVYEINKNIIKEVEFFDFYKGKQIPKNMKGMTFRICFQAKDRTLRDEEINKVFVKIVETLATSLGVTLRES
jgi:phenylalanyl-tRNA synthetase beta chain